MKNISSGNVHKCTRKSLQAQAKAAAAAARKRKAEQLKLDRSNYIKQFDKTACVTLLEKAGAR